MDICMLFIRPANDIGILMAPVVVTDRLAVDHNVAFVRSRSPNQRDWGSNNIIATLWRQLKAIF